MSLGAGDGERTQTRSAYMGARRPQAFEHQIGLTAGEVLQRGIEVAGLEKLAEGDRHVRAVGIWAKGEGGYLGHCFFQGFVSHADFGLQLGYGKRDWAEA